MLPAVYMCTTCGYNCSKPLSHLESLVKDTRDVGAYSPGSGLFQAPGGLFKFCHEDFVTSFPKLRSWARLAGVQALNLQQLWLWASLCGGASRFPSPLLCSLFPWSDPSPAALHWVSYRFPNWDRPSSLWGVTFPPTRIHSLMNTVMAFSFFFFFFQVVISLWKFYTMYAIPIHHTFFLCFFEMEGILGWPQIFLVAQASLELTILLSQSPCSTVVVGF